MSQEVNASVKGKQSEIRKDYFQKKNIIAELKKSTGNSED